jgi:hypothetical protein
VLTRLIPLTVMAIGILMSPMVTQCDPGSPAIPQCAPRVDALQDDCPHAPKPQAKPRPKVRASGRHGKLEVLVTFNPPHRSWESKWHPVDYELLVDGRAPHGQPDLLTDSPYYYAQDVWGGNVTVMVSTRGYHSCQIWVGGMPVTPIASANLGPVRCSYGPNTG